MKYFIVTHTIKDGEYEYMYQTPVEAKTEKEAVKLVEKDDQEWTEDDYREFEIDRVEKVTKKEFDIIKKYIY